MTNPKHYVARKNNSEKWSLSE